LIRWKIHDMGLITAICTALDVDCREVIDLKRREGLGRQGARRRVQGLAHRGGQAKP